MNFNTPETEEKMEDERNDVYGCDDDGKDVRELQRMLVADARRPESKYDYEEGPLLKVVLCTLAGLLVLVLCCGVCYAVGYQKALTSDEARELAAESLYDTRTKNGDVVEKSYMPEGGFTFDSDTMMLSEFYKSTSLDGTFYIFNNDGEFLQHLQEEYPEALYASNDWTPDEVLEFYHNSLESWAFYDSAYLEGKGYYICCTPDYKHCFAVKDDHYSYGEGTTTGWLIIDGVYTTVIDEQTADSLKPDDLIAQYRAGTWDGSLLRSKDYGTTVFLAYDQTELCYSYEKRVYSEEQDPLGLAYGGYENPWWYDKKLARKYDLGDYMELVCDFGYWSMASVECYPDLPDNFETERIVATDSSADYTLDVLLNDGHLQRYSRVELLDEWDLSNMTQVSLDDEVMCYAREPFNLGDEIYYLDDGKLYALRKGGEIVIVLDHADIVSCESYSRSLRWSTIFVLEEGELCCYDVYNGKAYVLDRDVLELDFDEIMAYKKADGYYTLYHVRSEDGPNYATLYLGDKTLDYYVKYRQSLWSAYWEGR